MIFSFLLALLGQDKKDIYTTKNKPIQENFISKNLFPKKFVLEKTLTANSDVYSVAFSPNGQYLATGSADKTIKIWDVSNGQLKSIAIFLYNS